MASNPTVRTRHASPYDDQALGKDEIRLLTMKSIHGTITLHTDIYELTEDLEYDAVSYVWGGHAASQIVICNKRLLLVSPTALEMLHYLHRYQAKTATRKIWIDAICINQSDQKEKSTQIPLMRDIYSRAATVIVWMGSLTLQTDVFFAEFRDVRKKSKDWIVLNGKDPDCRDVFDNELPCNADAFFAGLSQLLNNEWFKRLWTYQEIILPRNATVLCSRRCVDFDEFVAFVVDGVYHSNYIPRSTSTETDASISEAHRACISIQSYRRRIAGERRIAAIEPKNVPNNLHRLRTRHVKEPVDRVWAIVGLLDKNLRNNLTPSVDYSVKGRDEYWKTWIMFAKALMKEPRGMTLLNIPPTQETRPSYLPSWCPSFHGKPSCKMEIDGQWQDPVDKMTVDMRWAFSEDNSIEKSAERAKTVREHPSSFVSTVGHDNLLRIRGFVLDTIEEVVEHEKFLDMAYESYDSDSKEHMTLYDTAVAQHMRGLDLARRVFYGRSEGVTDVPVDFVMALLLDCRLTDEASNNYGETLPLLANIYTLTDYEYPWKQVWCLRQLATIRGHTFFSTKGGRIGYAHPGCKPGDQVAAFYGGDPLYIIRQLNPTKDDIDSTGQASDHVQYMGAAFIPHLMEQHQRDAAHLGPDTMFIIH